MRRRRAATATLALIIALAAAPAVGAHSEVVVSIPGDGASLADPPAEIVAELTEAVDPARSSMELRGPGGQVIATGGVPADGPPTRMTISGLPVLGAGSYEVRWTTVTPDDGGVERGTFAFTVVESTRPPASAPAAGSPTSAVDASPAVVASPLPAEPASPSPAPDGDAAAATGAADLIVPLLVLAAVVTGGAVLLLRRRR